MSLSLGIKGGTTKGAATASADTIIDVLCEGKPGFMSRLSKLRYVSLGTAHTLTCMRVLGTTTLSAAAASGQAVVDITADPGSIAANDYVVVVTPAGVQHLRKVSSVDTLEITLSSNVPAALAAGSTFYFLGIVGDTGHVQFKPTVSTATEYTDTVTGVCESNAKGEPMVVNSDNATAAGVIEMTNVAYTDT